MAAYWGPLGLAQASAVLVELPVVGGPGEEAGLQTGDVILEFEGSAVTTTANIISSIQQLGKGRDAKLALWRRGERLTLSVKLGGPTDRMRLTSDPQFNAERLEHEIAAYGSLLQLFSRDRFPLDWARLQNDLGNA